MKQALTFLTALLLAFDAAETSATKPVVSGEFVTINPLCADITPDSASHVGR